MRLLNIAMLLFFISISPFTVAQNNAKINWSANGNNYTVIKDGNITQVDPGTGSETVIIKKEQLTIKETKVYLEPQSYAFNNNYTRILIFTNTAKVWRYKTRGDYWILDILSDKLRKLGEGLANQSLMFAKLSPDGKKVAYVSEHNIYVEEISSV